MFQLEEGENRGVSWKSASRTIIKSDLNSLFCSLLAVCPWVNHHSPLVLGLFVRVEANALSGTAQLLKVYPVQWESRDSLSKDHCSWDYLSRETGGDTTLPLWVGLFFGHKILLKIISEACEVVSFTKDGHQIQREKNTPSWEPGQDSIPMLTGGPEIRAPLHPSPGKAGGRCFCHGSPVCLCLQVVETVWHLKKN